MNINKKNLSKAFKEYGRQYAENEDLNNNEYLERLDGNNDYILECVTISDVWNSEYNEKREEEEFENYDYAEFEEIALHFYLKQIKKIIRTNKIKWIDNFKTAEMYDQELYENWRKS